MSSDDLDIVVRLKGARAAAGDAKHLRAEVVGIGSASEKSAKGTGRFGRAVDQSGRSARKSGRSFVYTRKSIGALHAGVTGLTGALGFGAGLGLIGALKVSVDEGREAQKAGRSLNAVLKSTGAQSWITRRQIEAQATALSNLSGVDDEVIQKSGIMLLGFEQIQNRVGKDNQIFSRAQKAALNLAAARTAAGKSLTPTDAAFQLGKALDDPTKGYAKLARVGVTFTKGEEKRIEVLQKSGKIAEAQGVILDKVEGKVSGQARAQADPLKKLQVIFLNIAETVGLKLLPYIDKAGTAVGKWVTQVVRGTGQGGRFRDKVEEIWKSAKPVVFWFGRAAQNVFQFASEHPNIVKVAAALFLAGKALKLLRFGTAIRGAGLLIKALRSAAALRTGEKIASGLASGLGASKMASIGSKAGRVLGSTLGRVAGGVFAVALDLKLNEWMKDHGFSGSDIEHMLFPLAPRQQNPLGPGKGLPPGYRPGGGPNSLVFPDKNGNPVRGTPIPTPSRNAPSTPGQHHGPHSRIIVPSMPTPTMAGAGVAGMGGGDITVHVPLSVDGAVLWDVWHKHDRRNRNRR